jgi:hypothetical protein
LKSENSEPLKSENLEPLKSENSEPLKSENLEPLKSENSEPLKSESPVVPEHYSDYLDVFDKTKTLNNSLWNDENTIAR